MEISMRLWDKIKGVFNKMTGAQTIEQVLKIETNVSSEMENAIKLWGHMYQDKAPWLKLPTDANPEKVTSLGLPAYIASEKARMATLEFKSEITPIMKSGKKKDEATGLTFETSIPDGDIERAEYLNKCYQNTIVKDIRKYLELGIAKGGLVIKPYVANQEIHINYIQADDFYPISFDVSGNITEAAFLQYIISKDTVYTRVEHHKIENDTVTVTNRAFKAPKNSNIAPSNNLGKEVALSSISEWTNLAPVTKITSNKMLFAYFKMPLANTIDTHSPLGVSAYSRAVSLIKDADEQYSRLLWEFEGSELAIDVDRLTLNTWIDEEGNEISGIPSKQKRLYRKLELDEKSPAWNEFSPTIREASIISGLNFILRQIEDKCELSRGTISDPNDVAKTAEEIRNGKPTSYSANRDIQTALQDTLEDVVYIMNLYADIFNLAPKGEYNVSFEFGDGIHEDIEKENSRRLVQLDRGITDKVAYRMWYFGETKEQAISALAEVQQYNNWEAQQSIEREMDNEE